MKTEIEEVEINGTLYVKKGSKSDKLAEDVKGLKAVMIRSYAAGVHFGYLKNEKFTESGKVVTLVNTQRVWYWTGACSLSQLAIEGSKTPDTCKISVIVSENEIVNVIETIPMTQVAINNLTTAKIWKQ